MRIKFIGAAGGTITGSCTLLHHTASNAMFLVDCGLAQGEGHAEAHNHGPLPFDASDIRFVLLTHAHLDHCGLLPRLYREGFRGPVICTKATAQLARLSLLDSARYEQSPFTEIEAKAVNFEPVDDKLERSRWLVLGPNLSASFQSTAHIVGASSVTIKWQDREGHHRHLVMSGDLGNNTKSNRYQSLMAHRKGVFGYPDAMVVESTYGGQSRSPEFKTQPGRIAAWRELIQSEVFDKKSAVIIPAFALQRTHEVLLDVYTTLSQHFPADVARAPCLTSDPHRDRFKGGVWKDYIQARLDLAISELPEPEQLRWRSAIVPMDGEGKLFGLAPDADFTVEDLSRLAQETRIPWPVDVVLDSALAREMGKVIRTALEQRKPHAPDEFLYRNPDLKAHLCLDDEDQVSQTLLELLENVGSEGAEIPLGPHRLQFVKDYRLPGARLSAGRGLILITGGGMCDGGPVVTHLRDVICSGVANVLVQVGYMAAGSLGGKVIHAIRAQAEGRPFDPFEVGERVVEFGKIGLRHINMGAYYSGHADQDGLLDFIMQLDGVPSAPAAAQSSLLFINHGTAQSREALKLAVQQRAAKQRAGDREIRAIELPCSDDAWFDLLTGSRVDTDDDHTSEGLMKLLIKEQRKTNALLSKLIALQESKGHQVPSISGKAKPLKNKAA